MRLVVDGLWGEEEKDQVREDPGFLLRILYLPSEGVRKRKISIREMFGLGNVIEFGFSLYRLHKLGEGDKSLDVLHGAAQAAG